MEPSLHSWPRKFPFQPFTLVLLTRPLWIDCFLRSHLLHSPSCQISSCHRHLPCCPLEFTLPKKVQRTSTTKMAKLHFHSFYLSPPLKNVAPLSRTFPTSPSMVVKTPPTEQGLQKSPHLKKLLLALVTSLTPSCFGIILQRFSKRWLNMNPSFPFLAFHMTLLLLSPTCPKEPLTNFGRNDSTLPGCGAASWRSGADAQ